MGPGHSRWGLVGVAVSLAPSKCHQGGGLSCLVGQQLGAGTATPASARSASKLLSPERGGFPAWPLVSRGGASPKALGEVPASLSGPGRAGRSRSRDYVRGLESHVGSPRCSSGMTWLLSLSLLLQARQALAAVWPVLGWPRPPGRP